MAWQEAKQTAESAAKLTWKLFKALEGHMTLLDKRQQEIEARLAEVEGRYAQLAKGRNPEEAKDSEGQKA